MFKSRIVTLCLSLALIVSFIPSSFVFADEGESGGNQKDSNQATVEMAQEETSNNIEDVTEGETGEATTEESTKSSSAKKASSMKLGNGPIDITPYVTSLVLTKDGEEITSGTEVNHGDRIKLSMSYHIDGSIFATGRTYTYQLPSIFKVSQQGSVIRQGNKHVGTYTVSDDGLVTFVFNDDYNTENDTVSNTFEITGRAQFVPNANDDDQTFLYEDKSTVIVVKNPGDYSVKKTASKKIGTPLGTKDTIAYTVRIGSAVGSGSDFDIVDTLSIKNDLIEAATYDQSSFVITDHNDEVVSASKYTLKFAANNMSYEILGLPELKGNTAYYINYNVNVTLKEGSLSTGYVNNKVDVTAGRTKSATTQTLYSQILGKRADGYDQNRGILWRVEGYTNGKDLSGVTITDATSHTINTDAPFRVYIYRSDGTATLVTDGTVSIDGKNFTYTFPKRSYTGYARWRIHYYSAFDEADGKVTATNNVTLKTTEDEEWSQKDVKGEFNKQTAGIEKKFLSISEDKKTLTWSLEANYSGIENSSEVEIRDQLYANYVMDYGTTYSGSEQRAGSNHYALAPELDADLKDANTGLKFTIEANGSIATYTYADLIEAGYKVTIGYYDHETNRYASNSIDATDDSRKVKSFFVKVTKPQGKATFDLTKVTVDKYRTHFDMDRIMGTTYTVKNTASTLGQSTEANHTIKVIEKNLEKLAGGATASGTRYWDKEEASQNYTYNDGKIYYMLLATVADGQTELEVTDTLPEGLTLKSVSSTGKLTNERYSVGVYPYKESKSDQVLWSDNVRNKNVSVEYSEETNTVKVKVTGIDSALKLHSNRLISIQLVCDMPEKLSSLDGAEIVKDSNGKVVVKKTFENSASYGEITDSGSVTVTQNTNTLEKNGKQSDTDSNIVHYSIVINEEGLDLLADGDTLKLKDVITSGELSVSLIRGSVKLYAVEADGSKGEEVSPETLNISYPELDAENKSTQTFEMEVADETPYILEYDYSVAPIDASADGDGTLNNTVVMNGITAGGDDIEVNDASSKATSDHASLRLYKVDAKNNTIYLSGATFQLEEIGQDGTAAVIDESFTMDGEDGKLFDYFKKGEKLKGNTLYKITETKAPAGYQLDDTPFYFIIKGNIEDVRDGKVDASKITISTDEEAKVAANAPADLDINLLDPTSGSNFDIANEKEPELVSVDVEKVWDDAKNQDGKRPDSITINLLANGTKVDSKQVTEADSWKASFTKLPKFDAEEKEINYTVEEVEVSGYTTKISGSVTNGFTITNSYTPEKTSISVAKAWNDNNNQAGTRPASITVKLLADGEDTGRTLELSEDNNWTGSFTDLDAKKGGETIVYSVDEVAVEGYTTSIEGNPTDGYVITNIKNPNDDIEEDKDDETPDDEDNDDTPDTDDEDDDDTPDVDDEDVDDDDDADTPKKDSTSNDASPSTGDTTNVYGWVLLAMVSAILCMWVARRRSH